MPSEGEHQFISVFPDLPHGVDGHEVVQAASEFRGVLGTVPVSNPPFKFMDRPAKGASMFHAQPPEEQHGGSGIGGCRVGSLELNTVALTKRSEPVRARQP